MKILLAVSGGIDSVVLLDLFAKKRLEKFANCQLPTANCQLFVSHFNHRIHNQSDKHAKFVQQLADKYKLPFHLGEAKTQLKSEASAREARYRFFKNIAKKVKAKYIVLAHHADDQVETILFNLIRGSGLSGISGIQEISRLSACTEIKLWRPLLNISKSKIEIYARQHRLKFINDPTNTDIKYSRNFLRKETIPLLKKINPKFNEAILRTAKQARETNDFLELFAEEWLKRHIKKSTISLKKFNSLPFALARSVIRKIHLQEIGNLQKIEEKHVEEILSLTQNSHGGKQKKFGKLVFQTGKQGKIRTLAWKNT